MWRKDTKFITKNAASVMIPCYAIQNINTLQGSANPCQISYESERK